MDKTSLNLAIIVGRIGSEPLLKEAKSGVYCILSVGTSEIWNQNEKTQWHKVMTSGKMAEYAGNTLHKGDLVAITGKISYSTWGEGERKTKSMTIMAMTISVLLSSQRGRAEAAEQAKPPPWEQEVQPARKAAEFDDKDDCPF